MARTPSTMLELGTPAPDFCLPDTEGKLWRRDDFSASKGLLVVFWCNHCPYVQHTRIEFVRFARDYEPRGLAIVAINSNDVETYPEDSPERMREEKTRFGYPFPYLFDETQQVARAYRAACTPDFFLFDRERKLAYRGQFDASRPGNGVPLTGQDLRAASAAVLEDRAVPPEQKPSIGCNIKWKKGNEPGYFA